MNISDIINSFEDELEAAVKKLPIVRADKLGLDIRAGYRLYIDTDERAIYCPAHSINALDYYGGFEYVKENEGRTTLPRFIRFDANHSDRVNECFEAFEEYESEETNAGE